MTPFKPKLIVFDLDGTLVDSSPDISNAINLMLSALNQQTYSKQQIRHWMGNGVTMLIKRALTGELNPLTDPDNLQLAKRVFSDFYRQNVCVESQLYAGVKEGLDQLQAAKINLACVTNKPALFTSSLLTEIGIIDYFPFIASGDTYSRMKPDPLPLLEAANFFANETEHALMVGDSINDIRAGKSAGFKTALVPYGYIGKYSCDQLGADYQIDSIAHLSELLSLAY
ncbi:hypothetical protein AU255_01185 [Methyloprofundus sedimenti]|uniref:phosphoglycolate phosphatase n=1 Tax=Methyloprofundus sedimenti TaxID=1420851 RepID=A0A1V8M4R9_9GAMM|nr:phosphoglycolate phosphatase [Methyloprofundus sedimenti]OQK16549.1 hypothetical protein AU255_01185 [Methyloprofundus sedimenti]